MKLGCKEIQDFTSDQSLDWPSRVMKTDEELDETHLAKPKRLVSVSDLDV